MSIKLLTCYVNFFYCPGVLPAIKSIANIVYKAPFLLAFFTEYYLIIRLAAFVPRYFLFWII